MPGLKVVRTGKEGVGWLAGEPYPSGLPPLHDVAVG